MVWPVKSTITCNKIDSSRHSIRGRQFSINCTQLHSIYCKNKQLVLWSCLTLKLLFKYIRSNTRKWDLSTGEHLGSRTIGSTTSFFLVNATIPYPWSLCFMEWSANHQMASANFLHPRMMSSSKAGLAHHWDLQNMELELYAWHLLRCTCILHRILCW